MAISSTSTLLSTSAGEILLEVEDNIGWITISNPARRNAMNASMWEALISVTQSVEDDRRVRVVVLKGAGTSAFVSGADISELDLRRSDEGKTQFSEVVARGERSVAGITKPVIAMIGGFCLGAGVVLAVDADIRMAAMSARFGIPAGKLGLAFEQGAVAELVRLIGPSVAADLLFSARFLGADEALRVGLVNFVVEDSRLEEEVRAYARAVAMNAPLTLRAAKAAIRSQASRPHEEDVARVRAMTHACFASSDFEEGRRAFLEKRAPRFQGR